MRDRFALDTTALLVGAYLLVRGSGINDFAAHDREQRLDISDILNRNGHVVAVQHSKIGQLVWLERASISLSKDIQAPFIV
jgi:hypothetical protein